MLAAGADVHCLRDLTRGGLAAALNEIACDARVGIELDEAAIPVAEPVAAACELLGLDPLYVANEGRLVAFVPAASAERVLEVMRAPSGGRGPGPIGTVTREPSRHGRAPHPLWRRADRRSAVRRADAADLLTQNLWGGELTGGFPFFLAEFPGSPVSRIPSPNPLAPPASLASRADTN